MKKYNNIPCKACNGKGWTRDFVWENQKICKSCKGKGKRNVITIKDSKMLLEQVPEWYLDYLAKVHKYETKNEKY